MEVGASVREQVLRDCKTEPPRRAGQKDHGLGRGHGGVDVGGVGVGVGGEVEMAGTLIVGYWDMYVFFSMAWQGPDLAMRHHSDTMH